MKQKTKFKLIRLLIHVALLTIFVLGFSAFLEARTNMVSVLFGFEPNVSKIISVRFVKRLETVKKTMDGEIAKASIERIAPDIFCAFTQPEKEIYSGEFLNPQLTQSVIAEDFFTVAFYLKNTGNIPWFSDGAPCVTYRMRLGTFRDQDRPSVFFTENNPDSGEATGWIQKNRVSMKEKRVDPGEIATFEFTSLAPYAQDVYREYFRPVVEGKTWFSGEKELSYMDIGVNGGLESHRKHVPFLWKSGKASIIDPLAPTEITIDISDQMMSVKKGEVLIREYPVSTGTFKTPTPLGRATIHNKQDLRISNARPHYHMPNWQGLAFDRHRKQFRGFGLHALPYLANDRGTFWNEALDHIGQRVSHGCIRMLPKDAEELYSLTSLGDTVIVQE